ncbi:molybdopterin molybdotransferase [Cladophialophora psammophila CBS 110553]|uniref:Molybdopterin molybdotransferase n=1 Tax=Cladophialophora psammophila CBS 110553 TaxID=1182543 RepID=W9VLB6_9EURO|nr:molybdopterin molybdotransferase [Cladophialophora psammophila CBS 110553]EXJ56313.1 molybdopterin molybdotransferase [Cladophialophora psammophila CBS 110553]
MTSPPLLRPAILVVSDTAAADPSTDKSIPILKDVFSQDGAGKWSDPLVEIVKDDVLEIQRIVRAWTDSENETTNAGVVNLVVTTGGTGFARRDFTPEAIAPLIHRHAPGIVHGMLAASFQITPFAMMSRPVAGTRNKSIIITLPGSPKGAKENLQAVLKLLPHACLQAAGQDSRAAHVGGVKKLEKEAGVGPSGSGDATPATLVVGATNDHSHQHSHHHSHDHDHSHEGGGSVHGGHRIPKAHTAPSERPQLQSNDPRLGATARYRSSPYPMLNVSDAVAKIFENAPASTVEIRDVSPDLVGYVAAEDIRAAEAVPAYRASIVDGYAVIIPNKEAISQKSIKGIFPVASVSHAQASSLPPPLEKGQIARITTGAPLPENANAVVMVEDTVISTLTPDGKEEASVEILTDELVAGENVRESGSDIELGQVIVAKGTQISPLGGEIGVLAAAGIKKVPVYRKPRIGVMSTGDEVMDVAYKGTLSGGMIRDSNRPSLLTLLRGWRICEDVVDLGVARDTPHHELEHKLRDAFRLHGLDIVITTGGVSMGELDLLKPTIERALGGTVHFGRVNMKPGKPTTFATVPIKDSHPDSDSSRRETRLIFGLPGNPASALVTANLFVLPCIQRMTGLPDPQGAPRVKVRLHGRVRCDKARVEYHRVLVSADPNDGKLVARSTGMQRSSRVGSLASANGLLVLPQREGYIEDGGECEALIVGMVLGY